MSPTDHHLRYARATCTALSIAAAALLAYRIHRASAFGILEALTSLATGITIAAAVATGWMIHARDLRARAEAAEWEAAKARREDVLLDGEEDRAVWESVKPADTDDDTIFLDPKVIAINRYRYPKAG